MSESLRSMLLGTSALWAALAVAFVLTFIRPGPVRDPDSRDPLLRVFLLGLAAQCVHCVEEFVTGFHLSWPRLLGLIPWSAEFFVAFNLTWVAIWILSAVVLLGGSHRPHGNGASRWLLVPIWFFAIGMALNGIAHPLLALQAGGYFPGLASSPVVGVLGGLLWVRLLVLTRDVENPVRE